MKQNSNRNRSNGRNGRFNNNRRPANNITRNTVFDSSSPAGRVRGIAAQLIEKYVSLAKDAKNQDDRIMSEIYMQYADHYVRMLEIATANEAPKIQVAAVEDAPAPAPAQEAANVQKEQGEATDCGMVLDRQVPGAEAAPMMNVCVATDDAANQKQENEKRPVQKRTRRLKVEVKSIPAECAETVKPAEE